MASMGSSPASASASAPASAGAAGVQREEDSAVPIPALQREEVPEEEEKPVGAG